MYNTRSGKIPVKEFLGSLSSKHVQKVAWVLELVEKVDQIQYFKKLKSTDNIWEVRARIGSSRFRILGFIDGNECIALANGFSKNHRKHRKRKLKWQSSEKLIICPEKEIKHV